MELDRHKEATMRRWTVERRLLPVEPERLTSLLVYRMGWVRAELPADGPLPWVDLEVRVEPGPERAAWLVVIGAYAVARHPSGATADLEPLRTLARAKVRAVAADLAAETTAVLLPLPGVSLFSSGDSADDRGPLVRDVMDADAPVVDDDMPASEVAALLAAQEVDGAPVVDRTGRLLGVISERDLLGGLLWESGEADAAGPHPQLSAGSLCTRPAIVTGPAVRLGRAGQQMLFHGVRRLAVVDDGRLVGTVTRQAVFAALRRHQAHDAAERTSVA